METTPIFRILDPNNPNFPKQSRDIIGSMAVIKQIKRSLDIFIRFPASREDYGVLLYGPGGTGKTFIIQQK